MNDYKLTYEDLEVFIPDIEKIPSFILKRTARKKRNLIKKFDSQIEDQLKNLTPKEHMQLNAVLNSSTEELQALSNEAYQHTKMKQFKIMSDPKNKEFIELNLNELRKIYSKYQNS